MVYTPELRDDRTQLERANDDQPRDDESQISSTIAPIRPTLDLSHPALAVPLAIGQVAKDTLPLAKQGVDIGFQAAQTATTAGFWIAQKAMSATSISLFAGGVALATVGFATAGPVLAVSSLAVAAANSAVTVAKDLTLSSQDSAKQITQSSLDFSLYALDAAGIEDGQGLNIIFGQEQVEAAAFVQSMITSFLEEVPSHVRKRDLYRAFSKYAIIHNNTNFGLPCVSPDVRRLENSIDDDAIRYVRLSVGIYGKLPTAFMGVPKAPTNYDSEDHQHADVDTFCKIAGIANQDIVSFNLKGRVYGPGHIITLDRMTNSVVLVVRGTIRHHDALTDLVCRHVEFSPDCCKHLSEEDEHPGAHGGMLKSANNLANETHDIIKTTLLQNPGFRLVITGHSLGAGVATLLASIWGPSFKLTESTSAPVRCWAYAPPCTLTINSARGISNFATSVVCGADVVSRFGLSTTEDLREGLLAILEREDDLGELDNEDILRWLKDSVQTSGPKLFPGGRVLWLKTGADVEFRDSGGRAVVHVEADAEGGGTVFEADNGVFHTMAIRPAMMKNHLPIVYLREVEKLASR
jgi:hypothetical protein